MAQSTSSRRIVVGVDGSENSTAAIKWSVDNARKGDTVVLLTGWHPVIPPPEMAIAYVDDDSSMRTLLEEQAAKTKPSADAAGVALETKFVHLDPRTALLEEKADLVVVGARRHGGLAGLLLGSTADYVARHARVPVVIIPRVKD
ncbi:MAG: universal stress protein [Ilumatobacteraceae bacterium]